MRNILFIAALCVAISSCSGTRNVKKDEIKIENSEATNTEISTDIVINSNKDSTVDTTKKKQSDVDVVDTEENLEPIDPDKPMKKTVEEKDGKKTTTYENAKVNNKSKVDKSKIVEDENIIDKSLEKVKYNGSTKIKQDSNRNNNIESTSRESNRTGGFPWWIVIVLIFISGFLYIKFKK